MYIFIHIVLKKNVESMTVIHSFRISFGKSQNNNNNIMAAKKWII